MSTLNCPEFNFYCNDDASYRACIAYVKNVFDTVNPGLLSQTEDTGQVDVATVKYPASVSGAGSDYLIYRFDDGMGPPVFIRVNVYRGSTVGRFVCYVEIGHATNGAGVLSGNVYRFASYTSGSSSNTQLPSFACCSPGQLSIAIGVKNSFPEFALHISRFCDDAGDPLNTGIFAAFSGGSGFVFISIVYNGGHLFVTSSDTAVRCDVFSRASRLFGGEIVPDHVFCANPHTAPMATIAAVKKVDIGVGVEFDCAMVGARKRRFRNIGINMNALDSFAVIWE